MIILGLDPGIARTGFGFLDTASPSLFVRCGCLTTPAGMSLEDRLVILGNDLTTLLQQTPPDIAVVEMIFFGTNTTTAMATAHARGVLLYVLRQRHVDIRTLTPLQIKSRLTGHGRASKSQVTRMVTQRLHLSRPPTPDDAADALAAALCEVETKASEKV